MYIVPRRDVNNRIVTSLIIHQAVIIGIKLDVDQLKHCNEPFGGLVKGDL